MRRYLLGWAVLTLGMAVAALNSRAHLDPSARGMQWEEGDPGDNRDLAETQEMLRKLTSPTELGVVPPDTPVVLMGTSNGGSMASRVAQLPHLDVAAAVIYISNAAAFHEEGAHHPPMVMVPGAQDAGRALITNTTLAQDIDDPTLARLIVNTPDPVSDALWTRIRGVDCTLGIGIGQALRGSGLVRPDGSVSADPRDDKRWVRHLSEQMLPYESDISDVLVEAYGGHAPSSDQNAGVFDFVEAHL